MYKHLKKLLPKTKLKVNETYKGETLEQKISRIVNNKEPITDGAPLLYTDRKDGVQPQTNITTDKWEIAVEATEKAKTLREMERNFRQGERTFDTLSKEDQDKHIKTFPDSKYNKKTES